MPARPIGKSLQAAALCVAPDREAAEAGAAILHWGGNAFDAAVAAGFVEAVIAPHNCGIGGYGATGIGFLAGRGEVVALDANAVAPRAAEPAMFPVVTAGEPGGYRLITDAHKRGPLSVAVPGVLGGLLTMLETWGTRDRATVMAPAIRLARTGVALTPGRALTWLKMQAEAEGRPAPARAEVPRVVPMPELAGTLETIAAEGMPLFYRGRIGRAIADHVRKLGGILSQDDMALYRPLVVAPVTVEVRGHTLATPPPARAA